MLKNYLTVLDFCVIGVTLLFSLGIGIYYAVRGKKGNNEELLAGGRSMGAIPVAASMLVSYISSIAILGTKMKEICLKNLLVIYVHHKTTSVPRMPTISTGVRSP